MLESVQHGSSPPLLTKFSEYLAEVQAKNGRIYMKRPPPTHYCVLRPDSPFRMTWDFIIMFLLFYIALVLPYNLGFQRNKSKAAEAVDLIIDMFFVVDVILNFRTAYYHNDALVMDGQRIFWNYVKTWATLDILTCVPLENITAGVLPDMQPAKLVKIGKVVKVGKLLRLSKLKNVFQDSEVMEYFEDKIFTTAHQAMMRVLGMVLTLIIICHWLACGAGMVGDKWMLTAEPGGHKLKYEHALYWAMMTLTTVGYGDIVPSGTGERFYTIGAMIIGGCFYGFMIGKISSTIAARDLNAAAFTERMQLVHSWLEYHSEIPRSLRRRIKKYFINHLNKKGAADDIAIMNDLSPSLVHDVSFFLVQEEVRCNVLFHSLPSGAVGQLLSLIGKTEFAAEETIVAQGDPGEAMFVILHGIAKFEAGHQWRADAAESSKMDEDLLKLESGVDADNSKSERTLTLSTGDSFGEEIILELEEEYQYTIVSKTAVNMLEIQKDAFIEHFKHMPDMLEQMHNNFTKPKQVAEQANASAKKRGRSSIKEGVVQAFPDLVLDKLDEMRKWCGDHEAKMNKVLTVIDAPEISEAEKQELCDIDRATHTAL
jgi:CRP-like cAMP-binding protein